MTDKGFSEILKKLKQILQQHLKNLPPSISHNCNAVDSILNSKLYLANVEKDFKLLQTLTGNKAVLDLGCGIGWFSVLLQSIFPRVYGIDIGADTSQISRKKLTEKFVKWRSEFWEELKRHFPTVHFQIYDGIKIPFESQSFDVVVAHALIEHIPDKIIDRLLQEIERILKYKGSLIIMRTPRKQSFTENLTRILGIKSHLVLIDEEEVKILLTKHNFQILSIERTDLMPGFPAKLTNSLYWIFRSLDTILLNTLLNYFAHHMRIVAEKSIVGDT